MRVLVQPVFAASRRSLVPLMNGSRVLRAVAPHITRSCNLRFAAGNTIIRRCGTETVQNKAMAKPVGRIQLWTQTKMAQWRNSSWEERIQTLRLFGIVSGAIFCGTVLMQMFYKTSMWAVNITAYQAFKWGAATGATGAACLVLTAGSIRKMFQVRPDPIYRMVLKLLQRDERVVKALGKPLKTGKFRAYRYETKFPQQKLQLMFELNGSIREAKCSVEVARTMSGQYDFGLLAVDVHGTGDRIVLNGDAARELSGNVKGLK